jgi:hypothetical protein
MGHLSTVLAQRWDMTERSTLTSCLTAAIPARERMSTCQEVIATTCNDFLGAHAAVPGDAGGIPLDSPPTARQQVLAPLNDLALGSCT